MRQNIFITKRQLKEQIKALQEQLNYYQTARTFNLRRENFIDKPDDPQNENNRRFNSLRNQLMETFYIATYSEDERFDCGKYWRCERIENYI